MYVVHNVQMALATPCVSVGTLMQNCSARNVAFTYKDKPLSHQRRDPISKHTNSWNEYELGHGS
jgi:hypothetical protein